MGGRYPHLIRAVLERPWAIDPHSPEWAAVCDVLAQRAAGDMPTPAEIEARISAHIEAAETGPRAGGARRGPVAVIPIYGLISGRTNLMTRMSAGATAEDIGASFIRAMDDSEIAGVVFDIDSPGGSVDGIEELGSLIRSRRGQKPISAVAFFRAASAAYWIAAQADEVVVAPSGSVGSIGCIAAHEDISAAMEMAGVKVTFITSAKYKAEGNAYEPLTDEAREEIQRIVDAYGGRFVVEVAKGRGVSAATVRQDFGQGRMFLAGAAKAAGLADRVDTLDNTIARMQAGRVAMRPIGTAAADPGYQVVDVKPAIAAVVDEPAPDPAPDPDPELEATPEPVEADEASPTPPPPSARVPGRRAQRQLRELALGLGYSITD